MKSLFAVVLLLGFVACAYAACVAPPSDLNVCSLPGNARVPQEFSNTNADRQLQAYFQFLENIKATPTRKCAEAYIEFACSQAYPRCNGDANSGLGQAVNACYYQCSNFIEECRGQLIGVDRPNCGQFSVAHDCSGRKIKLESSGSSALSTGLMLVTFMAALVAAL